jgi:hypothetical protein
MQGDLRLTISPGVGDALAVILTTALRLPAESDVVDSLPLNPWGDVERFRSEVYDPVLGKAPPTEIESGLALYVPGADQAHLARVLEAMGESTAEGVPWLELTPPERGAAKDLLAQLTRIDYSAEPPGRPDAA